VRSTVVAAPDVGALGDLAAALFGSGLAQATRYAEHLATVATERGLIGPREVPRLWERHLLNSAAVAELVPPRSRVLDVGSGAGLPGIPLALARPDITVTLLDSMLRRTTYLSEVIVELGLSDRVAVVRARVEEHDGQYDVVVARAVAPMATLAGWTGKRAVRGGVLLALRGEHAQRELHESRAAMRAAGWGSPSVVSCGVELQVPTTVIRAVHV
jgi:16S rRNA (guanine527-N7)-methyltransferase